MNTLIIDNATLGATKLKYLLKNRNLNAIIINVGEVVKIKEAISNYDVSDVHYIFISAYLGEGLPEFINNFITQMFPSAHIILLCVKDKIAELPPTQLVLYDGVLSQPFSKKEIDKLLLALETS